jgi:hypothetical protein
MIAVPAGVDAVYLAEAMVASRGATELRIPSHPIRRSFAMRTIPERDLTVLRAEVADVSTSPTAALLRRAALAVREPLEPARVPGHHPGPPPGRGDFR